MHLLGSFEYVKNKKKGTKKEKAVYWVINPRAELKRHLTDFANNYEDFDPCYYVVAIQALSMLVTMGKSIGLRAKTWFI